MVHSARRVSHLGERVHRPRPHEWTARRWVRRLKFRKRREVSAGSAQLLEEDWSQDGGRTHTQSALPSSPESVGCHGRSKFEFQRPGTTRMRAWWAGPCGPCFVPAPGSGHVTRPGPPGWCGAASLLLHPRPGWRRLCRSTAEEERPAVTHAPTHALAGPFLPLSAPAALPCPSVGLTNPVRPPEEGLACHLDLLRDHSGGSPHSQPGTSSLSGRGKEMTVTERATSSFTGPLVSNPSQLPKARSDTP